MLLGGVETPALGNPAVGPAWSLLQWLCRDVTSAGDCGWSPEVSPAPLPCCHLLTPPKLSSLLGASPTAAPFLGMMLSMSLPPWSPPGFEPDPQHRLLFHLASETCSDKHLMSSAPPSFPAYFPAFFSDLVMDFTGKRNKGKWSFGGFFFLTPQRDQGRNQLKVILIISCSSQGFTVLPILVPSRVRPHSLVLLPVTTGAGHHREACRSSPGV